MTDNTTSGSDRIKRNKQAFRQYLIDQRENPTAQRPLSEKAQALQQRLTWTSEDQVTVTRPTQTP